MGFHKILLSCTFASILARSSKFSIMRTASYALAVIVFIAGNLDTTEGCCDKIYARARKGEEKVKKVYEILFKNTTTFKYMDDKKENAFPYYYEDEGDQNLAIWFLEEEESWIVGQKTARSTTNGFVYAVAPTAKCPEDVYNFKYYDNRFWNEAGKGLSFFCKTASK